ncbi:MAG: (Fe-S)-binding protein [Nitrososphaerales archaeon]
MISKSEEIRACAFCYSMCRHMCMIASILRTEISTPRVKGLLLYSVLKGKLKMDKKLARQFYLCTNCGRCHQQCETKAANPPKVFEAARAEIVEMGLAPDEALKVRDSAVRTKNVYGMSGTRFEAVKDKVREEASVALAYFIDDTTAYLRQEIAKATAFILESLDIEFAVSGQEWSDGLLLYILGFRELAKSFAEHNIRAFKALKPSLILFSDPMSYTAFQLYYPEMGIDTSGHTFMHLSEFLSKERLNFEGLNAKVTYFDPCFLGRRSLGLYEQPREILRRMPGLELVEMRFNREQALCCGGLLRFIDEDLGREAARMVIEAVKKLRVDFVITSCPRCKEGLLEAGVKVLDLAEVVAEAKPRRG